MRFLVPILSLALGAWLAVSVDPAPGEPRPAHFPPGTEVIGFENLEGLILLKAKMSVRPGRDTTGLLALDTGAGFLALDHRVAHRLELIGDDGSGVQLSARPLSRLELGAKQIDQVMPVMSLELEVIRRLSDRPILGLLGKRALAGHAVFVNYQNEMLALIPNPATALEPLKRRAGDSAVERSRLAAPVSASRRAVGRMLSVDAVAVPFQLAGDDKMLIRARVSDPRPPRYSDWLTLIVDTGATKSVLFEGAMASKARHISSWAKLEGLSAQNLFGESAATLARVPALEVETSERALVLEDVVFGILESDLARVLEMSVGEPVHGLLGYSFLRRFQLLIDDARGIMWLDPAEPGWNDRPHEYSHVGIQVVRDQGGFAVHAVASGSPAERAGIRRGDRIVSVDGQPVGSIDLVELTQRLEGPPGTRVRIITRRNGAEQTIEMKRQRLF